MKTVLSILNEIASTASGNGKIEILNKNKNNETLKRVVFLANNPTTKFWIKKIPNYVDEGRPIVSLDEALKMLSRLTYREVTGNEAIAYLRAVLESLTIDDAVVLARVIDGDLRSGFSVSTANKVWGKDFIKEWPVMKASPLNDKTIAKIKYPALAQLKIDGMRCTAIRNNTDITLYSATGNVIEVGDIVAVRQLAEFMPEDKVVDGELVVLDKQGKILPRKTGNGIINKAVKGTITQEESERICFIVFDLIDEIKFIDSKPDTTPYKSRWKDLNDAFVRFHGNNPQANMVRLAESEEVKDYAGALAAFHKWYNAGQEGIILKDYSSIWEDRRSPLQVKFKGIISADLRVVAVEEGTGKNVGKVGALVCETSDGLLEVNVGTGFSDEDRALPFDYYIGKIIEAEYNELILSKVPGAKHSLFLPRFVCVRTDKKGADTLAELQAKGVE